jgi:hypothetical protein
MELPDDGDATPDALFADVRAAEAACKAILARANAGEITAAEARLELAAFLERQPPAVLDLLARLTQTWIDLGRGNG